jgi:hypothetical protein
VKLTEGTKPYDVGYVTLYSSGGLLLSHPNPALIGKNVTHNKDFAKNISNSIYKNILKKQYFEKDIINVRGEKIFLVSVPVSMGIPGEELMACVYVPYEAFTERINDFLL